MKKLFFAFAAFAALASCAKKEISSPVVEPSAERHEVSFVATAAETKTQLDDKSVIWEADDAIRLKFTKSEAVLTEEFTVSDGAGTNNATFKGSVPNTLTTDGGYSDNAYAVYPSSAMDPATGTVTFTLDAAQQVAPGSFPSGKNLTSALISLNALNAGEVENALMQNAFAIMRFTLPEHVASLKITGTAGLAGAAALDFDEYGRLAVSSWTSESASVTLTPAEGETFSTGETYNILIYPGTHSKLSVELTHDDGCKLSKTLEKEFVFEAKTIYTFDFQSEFMKDYSIEVEETEDLVFDENSKILTVFPDYTQELKFMGTKATAIFTGVLPASLVHSETPVTGYALYPSTAYNEGVITYELSATEEPAGLWSAALSVTELAAGNAAVAFNSVEELLSHIQFAIPAGIKSVKIVSSLPLVGKVELTVGEDGKFVAGTADTYEITLDSVAEGTCLLNVFPVSGAYLTFTLTDASGSEVVLEFEDFTVGAGETEELTIDGSIDFDKDGDFGNEDFVEGEGTIIF